MKIEEQVCSLESAKKLKELGVKQDSYFAWYTPDGVMWKVRHEGVNHYSAFTVAELGELLPASQWSTYKCRKNASSDKWFWECEHQKINGLDSRKWKYTYKKADTEAEARAKMLIYLIEKGLV